MLIFLLLIGITLTCLSSLQVQFLDHMLFCTIYSCNMGTSDLPEMYAQSPKKQPKDCRHTFQANHAQVPMLYNTSVKDNSLNANMSTSTSTGFFIYACLKCPKMVM